MAIEPCWNTQAAVFFLWIFLPDFEGRLEPTRIPEGWSYRDHLKGIFELFHLPSGHPCTEMGCFHCTGTSSGSHQFALF